MFRSLMFLALAAALMGGLGCGGSGIMPGPPSAPVPPAPSPVPPGPPPPPTPPPPPPGPPGSPDPAVVYSGHTFAGDVRIHQVFHSAVLNNDRTYWVYLPPQYATNPAQRFPVLYLGDGDAMFDSTWAGQKSIGKPEWQVDETAERLIRAGIIPPLIIVAVQVAPGPRWYEYTPTYDAVAKTGGRAPLYAQMMLTELKPEIDRNYRTLTDAANTGVGGSSLGGLLSVYLARTHPEVFSKVIAFSASMSWDMRREMYLYGALPRPLGVRYWVDRGDLETSPSYKEFADTLGSKGWLLGRDYQWYIGSPSQTHNDLAWRKRVEPALRFLYGQ